MTPPGLGNVMLYTDFSAVVKDQFAYFKQEPVFGDYRRSALGAKTSPSSTTPLSLMLGFCASKLQQLLEFDHCCVINRSDSHGFLLSQGR